jgi:aspartyl-tRNA(Asn)/glutamyl-tRNA(Gln) amidotransferase subunit A
MTRPNRLHSLTELMADLEAGRISSVEATEASLKATEDWQPKINAFIRVDGEKALEAAKAADAARVNGDTRPLLGAPLANKDMFLRKGDRSSGGSAILGDIVGDDEATVITRLNAAGALETGRLNMSEFAAGPTGHNAHYGHARNPWNPEHITGGSSSGSGAATAAGCVYGALGSDTGGSIRLPAIMCGLFGLKPTYGRVSRYGAMPRAWSLDTVGPLTRSAADAALILAAIAGHDPKDPTTSRRPVPDWKGYIDWPIKGLRLAKARGEPFGPVDPETAAAHETALKVFEGLGAEIIEVDLPDCQPLYSAADAISKSEAATLHARWMRERPDNYAVHVYSRTEAGFAIPATVYLEAQAARANVLRTFCDQVLGAADAVLMPSIMTPVPSIKETDDSEPGAITSMVAGITRATRPFNYLGLPVLATPLGLSTKGLPLSCQLVARPFAERTLLSLGHAYEQATDHAGSAPPLPG